jgi:hypothetical protein
LPGDLQRHLPAAFGITRSSDAEPETLRFPRSASLYVSRHHSVRPDLITLSRR